MSSIVYKASLNRIVINIILFSQKLIFEHHLIYFSRVLEVSLAASLAASSLVSSFLSAENVDTV